MPVSNQPYSVQELRRGAWHFLSGRAASAFLSFGTLLVVVRLLPIAEYGAYMTFVAWLEFIVAISGLGLPWLAARYIPDYRLHANGAEVVAVIRHLLLWMFAALAAVVVVSALLMDYYLEGAGLAVYRSAALIYLLAALLEGVARQTIEGVLNPLMRQVAVRSSLVARQVVFLSLIAVIWYFGAIGLQQVVVSELVASAVGASIALSAVWRYGRAVRSKLGVPGWVAPAPMAMWRTALNMYVVQLVSILYSPQFLVLVVQRMMGSEAAAIFGFLRGLYGQVARLLPATLLFSLVRPKLVASYVGGRGVQDLANNANLMGKLSLVPLIPIIAFAPVGGEALVGLLSGGKFPGTGLLFFGLMISLLPYSQRLLAETVAVASGQSDICTVASLTGFAMPPLMLWLVHLGFGLWVPILILGIGHLAVNAVILNEMRRRTGYAVDFRGAMKLALALPFAYLAAWAVPLSGRAVQDVSAALLCSVLMFLIAAWLLRPFSVAELGVLRRMLSGKG